VEGLVAVAVHFGRDGLCAVVVCLRFVSGTGGVLAVRIRSVRRRAFHAGGFRLGFLGGEEMGGGQRGGVEIHG